LIAQLQQTNYDLLLPTHEEVYLLSRFQNLLSQKTRFAVPSLTSLRAMLGKIEFAEAMRSLQLPVPSFQILHSVDDLKRYDRFPCFLKLNYGTAGQGVRRIDNASQRQAAMDDLQTSGQSLQGSMRVLVQQPAVGQMYVAQAVFCRGELIAAHCAKVLQSGVGGGALLRVGTEQPLVVRHLRSLGRELEWHGALFLEYFWDPAKDFPEYIECNPRLGEPVNAKLSGVDLVGALAAVSLDPEGTKPGDFGHTQPGVRSHIDFIALLGYALEGASRATLYRQWRMMTRQAGSFAEASSELTRPQEDRGSCLPAAFVIARLLHRPAAAEKMVASTVRNYALPQSAIDEIDQLDEPAWNA